MPNSFMVKALDKTNILHIIYVQVILNICRSLQQGGGLTSNLSTIQADEKLPFYGGHQGFGK